MKKKQASTLKFLVVWAILRPIELKFCTAFSLIPQNSLVIKMGQLNTILSSRATLKVGTWNVVTIYTARKLGRVANKMRNKKPIS